MKKFNIYVLFLCIFALCCGSRMRAQVSVTTWHNDLSRSGANTQETVLTPANVHTAPPPGTTFTPVFDVGLDGDMYAQPLYISSLSIAGSTHNVIFVATEHDSIYAIDADTGALLWTNLPNSHVSFLRPAVTTISSTQEQCNDISPEVGITGTPVIDTSTGTLYVVASTYESGAFFDRLHALDIHTGAEKFGGPKIISGTVPGNGTENVGGVVSFDPIRSYQRAGLALTNGHVIIALSGHCDPNSPNNNYHGWLMSYNASSLAQEAVFSTTPNGNQGGIWMSGAAPAVDASGNIYVSTGNGTYDGTTNFGDSILKMPPPIAGHRWAPIDWFTPFNQGSLKDQDLDVGAGGVLLFPDLPVGQPHRQRLVLVSKAGEIYIVDRSNMGKFCSSCTSTNTNIVQDIQNQLGGQAKGTPAYWDGKLFIGSNSRLNAFSFNTTTGTVSSSPTSTASHTFGEPGPTPSVSANGNSAGIVWVLDNSNGFSGSQEFLAYDATTFTNPLLDVGFGAPCTSPFQPSRTEKLTSAVVLASSH